MASWINIAGLDDHIYIANNDRLYLMKRTKHTTDDWHLYEYVQGGHYGMLLDVHPDQGALYQRIEEGRYL